MDLTSVLPDPASLAICRVTLTPTQITLVWASTPPSAACPVCGQASYRIHSRYSRCVADLPWQGIPVQIQLHARRFLCPNSACSRHIFTERLPAVVASYARKTCRLRSALELLALALGGEPGARVAGELAMGGSPDTLLRWVRRAPLPIVDPPRVLGVDDWAFRKGTHYGTILCDLERHKVVDLLPQYAVAPLRAWLAEHSGIEVISRDRGRILIQGATAGAPQAQQVADHFHLLKNLHEALVRVLDRRGNQLQEAAAQVAHAQASSASHLHPAKTAPPTTLKRPIHLIPATADQKVGAQARAQRRERYRHVLALHHQGLSQRDIARRLDLHRSTVARFLQADAFPERATRHCVRKTDAFFNLLQQRWAQGCHNAAQLARELTTQGFTGSRHTVKRAVAPWRERPAPSASRKLEPATPNPRLKRPSARRVAWLLVKPPKKRTPDEEALVTAVRAQSKSISQSTDLVLAFQDLVRQRNSAALAGWMTQAQEAGNPPELRAFADGLRQDLSAVQAALQLPWSTGQVEGQINHLKTLKRQMYGRAKFDLLRRRMLLAG